MDAASDLTVGKLKCSAYYAPVKAQIFDITLDESRSFSGNIPGK
jgi:hypothetical protein